MFKWNQTHHRERPGSDTTTQTPSSTDWGNNCCCCCCSSEQPSVSFKTTDTQQTHWEHHQGHNRLSGSGSGSEILIKQQITEPGVTCCCCKLQIHRIKPGPSTDLQGPGSTVRRSGVRPQISAVYYLHWSIDRWMTSSYVSSESGTQRNSVYCEIKQKLWLVLEYLLVLKWF